MARSKRTYNQSISSLGLNSGASPESIKEAYRDLAKKYHPDVYKLDEGERFKEINAAYRYLKSHPDPPENYSYEPVQRNYRRTSATNSRNSTAQKRREHYRKRKQKEEQLRREMHLWLFKKLKPFVLIVLIFNILLTIDFILPKNQEEKTLINHSAEYDSPDIFGSGYTYEYDVLLDDKHKYTAQTDKRNLIERGGTYILEKSLIFGTYRSLIYKKTGDILTPPYSIYVIFGFLIPFIFLLEYLYFYKVRNYDLRLLLVAFMIISVLMQLGLTFL